MFRYINGNMLDELDKLEPNSIDSIVTDPPYELNFMGKGWDNTGISFQKETWEKCFRVLKPGGHILAFGGSRTFHRIACAIEDAGFEIRDTIMWIYGSGFPKSMNIGLAIDKRNGVESKVVEVNQDILTKQKKDLETEHREILDSLNVGAEERNNEFNNVSADIKEPTSEDGKKWKGWGTQLKPAFEPIIMARKPVENSIIDNVLEYGVGGINIDECRIQHNEEMKTTNRKSRSDDKVFNNSNSGFDSSKLTMASANPNGRFPSNVILTYGDNDFSEVCNGFPNSKGSSSQNVYTTSSKYGGNALLPSSTKRYNYQPGYNDDGSASRYFYCAKATNRDRNSGLEGTNNHTTVKPVTLMQYLVRLVTPVNGVVLDPFMGSGSTGKATAYENNDRDVNYTFIGVELNEEYYNIAKARIEYAITDKSKLELSGKELKESKEIMSNSIFSYLIPKG